jgi:hypothetical protein
MNRTTKLLIAVMDRFAYWLLRNQTCASPVTSVHDQQTR